MRKPELNIRLSADQYKSLGVDVCAIIKSGEDARSALEPRWSKVTAYYNNEPVRESWRWLKRYKLQHFPLIQPKVDQLCAILTTSIFSQSRTLLARQAIGGARYQPIEDLIQFFLDQGAEQAVDEMAPIAACTNHGALFVPFEVRDFAYGKEPVGFGYYGIAPQDFVVYPTHVRSLDEAIYVGHRKTMTLDQVTALQDSGRYRKCAVTPGQDPESVGAGMGEEQRTPNTPAKPGHSPVRIEVGVLQVKLPGKDKAARYYIVTAYDTQEVLRIDEYPFRKCRYIDLRVKPRQYGGYWSMTSVGQDLQSSQWQYNQLQNLLVAGQWIQAFPWGVTDGKVDKAQEIGPMSFLQVNGQTTFPQLTFNAGELPFMIQQVERQADAITRVTQESTGVAISKRQTLGEMKFRQAGASQGLQKFLQTFGNAFAEIGYTMQEQLAFHYDLWSGVYPEQAAALGDPDSLETFLTWDVQGKTPDTTSSEIIDKLAYIEQMAERDIQEAMALGFDPTFDISRVRAGIANTLRPPNVQDYFFDPENPSQGMQAIIAGTIQQKAQAMAEQMAQQQDGQMQMQFEQESQMKDMEHAAEVHGMKMDAELKDMKTATALHSKDMQLEAARAKASTKATNGKK